jgi:KTSC domain
MRDASVNATDIDREGATWGRRYLVVPSEHAEVIEASLYGPSLPYSPEWPTISEIRRIPSVEIAQTLRRIGEPQLQRLLLAFAVECVLYEVRSPEWTGEDAWMARFRERTSVVSRNVSSIGYDAATQVLEVEFRDHAVYRYADVTAEEHAAIMAAPSKGAHLVREIRPRHRGDRVRCIRPSGQEAVRL